MGTKRISEQHNLKIKAICITGGMYSGKTTVAKIIRNAYEGIYPYQISPMAAELKRLYCTYAHISKDELTTSKERHRKGLQQLGSILRSYHPQFWARVWGFNTPPYTIVDDMRFPEEWTYVKEQYPQHRLIHVISDLDNRKARSAPWGLDHLQHESENQTWVNELDPIVITNNGTLEELETEVRRCIRGF